MEIDNIAKSEIIDLESILKDVSIERKDSLISLYMSSKKGIESHASCQNLKINESGCYNLSIITYEIPDSDIIVTHSRKYGYNLENSREKNWKANFVIVTGYNLEEINEIVESLKDYLKGHLEPPAVIIKI